MNKIIDCRKYAKEIKENLKMAIEKQGLKPRLEIFQVGDDAASASYIKGKQRDCAEIGIECLWHKYTDDDFKKFYFDLQAANNNRHTHGIIIQLPVPEDFIGVTNYIDYRKDVDGFRDSFSHFDPCTPKGILYALEKTGIDLDGKHVVIINRSRIVGKPLAKLLLEKNATVTICHSHTKNLKMITHLADIIVVAVGIPKFLTVDMVKPGAVVIDVGVNRDENGHLIGDADFDNLRPIVSKISTVPGGVGLMTRAMLMVNVAEAAGLENWSENNGQKKNGN